MPQSNTPNEQPQPARKFNLRSPGGIVFLYAVFSVIWITVSDHVLVRIFRDVDMIERIGALKGYFFITITATLLYLLLRGWQHLMVEATDKAMRNKRRLQRAMNGSNDGWWDWDLEKNEPYYSPRWWQMLGYKENELPPDSDLWLKLLHPDDRARVQADLDAVLASNIPASGSIELRQLHKDGHYVPFLVRYTALHDTDGKAIYLSGSNMDLTERKQVEERLNQAAIVFNTTREGVMVTDADGRITMVNNAFCEISGYTEAEVLGKSPSMLSSGHHDKNFYNVMWTMLTTKGSWCGEIWNRRKNGDIYPELLSISKAKDKAGNVLNYVGVFADISKLKNSESQLDFLAHHDPLTQLPNRLLLISHLEHAIKTAQRDQISSAILMLDLDRFKDVNDSYGHAAGDELLQQVSDCVRSNLREMDTIARIGGDEFIILVDKIVHMEDAARLANQIAKWLNRPWQLSNNIEVHIGVSIGISIFPDHGMTAKDLLQHADAALYQAKKEGRGCFRYFSENLTLAARERINLESRLHQAILHDQLRVYYQPQVDITNGHIIGAEALVRWEDPTEGTISPDRFIPIAEETGLINDIGKWVLTETCLQGQRWIEAGHRPMTLAVNVSPRQFLQSDICAMVEQALAATGFPARYLELELTESALMEHEEEVVAILKRLRSMGVRLAIDDFGTGYSSLAYLKKFPLDKLKIDRCFIKDIPFQQDDMAIASTIVSMSHTLGFKVLAEGVETAEQFNFLKEQGCDLYQGYLTSRPVPAAEFERLITSGMLISS